MDCCGLGGRVATGGAQASMARDFELSEPTAGGSGYRAQVREEFAATMQAASDLLTASFDLDNAEHVALAGSLFAAVFPDDRLPSDLVTRKWKEMGFQRQYPVSDLRASGLLGLWLLDWFATNYHDAFLDLVNTHRPRDDIHYPVAAAGLNIAALVADVLQLRIGISYAIRTPIYDELASWISSLDDLGEFFCSLFVYFEERWHADGADYMAFNAQLAKLRSRLLQVIPRKNLSGEALEATPFSRVILDERLYDESLEVPAVDEGSCTIL
ncbi:engulfment and cell motility [Thecamonas trahens ATCC 50062]|uniref:Engulfment and cell motility n=1 Tax=Thecamonas trahens ATCC 50062 TaxID=461836 RepID=A0A0L0DNH0_THETB|nr:engulfment and cell motility [Thecamonas trahens ATCC 50062]KNC52963.1 engulfment and cell motility [Thecamonas trahens ATCC 50062]|eukprot:XP_013754855.1 engulfment and cell motility [Thecamonas trahens ATCC 50062]